MSIGRPRAQASHLDPTNALPYSAPLDGIRAIAILAVLVFHVAPRHLRGGFTGVDVFFVLSGFLITSIILHDLRKRSFSLREFYIRRIQRLLPNAVVTVLAVVALWSLLMAPSAARLAARHGLWTLANLSNFFIWTNLGGYWGDAAESAPLLHTWSLAIEEQFYLFFPTSLVLVARYQRNRATGWLLGTTAVSLVLCLVMTGRSPVASFYLLPTRVWELLLGATIASLRTPLREGSPPGLAFGPRVQEAAGWLGLLLVGVGFLTIDEAGGFPGAKALVPTIGTALLIVAATGENRISRVLSTPFMVWTGKLSYSLYLWHWPLITLGKIEAELRGVPPLAGAVAGAVAGVALAWAAYLAVEQPLRSRGPGRTWRLATIGAGLCATVAATLWSARALPMLDVARDFDPPEFQGLRYAAGKMQRGDLREAVRYQDVRFPPIADRADDAWRSGGIIHPWGGGRPAVVVLGSSHALMYSRLVDDLCRGLGVSVAFLGVDETPPFFAATVNESFPTRADARAFDETRRRLLREWRPRAVLLVDRWDARVASGGFEAELRAFLSEVTPLAKTVLFVAQVPVAATGDGVNLREYMAWRARRGHTSAKLPTDAGDPNRRRATAIAEAARAEFSNLEVLRPDLAFLNEDGSIHWAEGRSSFYADDDHLSEAGADHVRALFARALADATSSRTRTSALGTVSHSTSD